MDRSNSFALSFRHREEIPPLAWCLEAPVRGPTATVWHGARVETARGAFFEGAWDGAFTEMAIDQAVCMGSGGRIRGDELVLVTSSHTLEALYSVHLVDRLIVSNSLAFLLVRARLDLDPNYRRYLLDLRSVAQGIDRCMYDIPTRQHVPVRRHFFCNLVLDEGLELRREPKPPPPPCSSFEQHRNFLRECLGRIALNANDDARNFKYPLIASLSRGYDSTASAVIAQECGCRQAVTIVNASWGASSDDGTEIGELLGFDVIQRRGEDFHARPGVTEAEFVALGDTGDVIFSNFEDDLTGRTFVTGYYGDTVWDLRNPAVGQGIPRRGAGGLSILEFRLRVGFVHVPVPFIGCRNLAEVKAIAESPELEPWRIGGLYDRPVPRRIAEEAGIPREMFGQTKTAAAIWWTSEQPNAESKESYEKFRSANRTRTGAIAELVHAPLYRFSRVWRACGGLAARGFRRLGREVRIPQIVPRRFLEPAGEAQLVQWGMSIVRRRYEFAPQETELQGGPGGSAACR